MAGEHLPVLNALDVAKIQWYHVKVLMVAAMGFFSVSYNLSCFFLSSRLLGSIYYPKEGHGVPFNLVGGVLGVSFCGVSFCGVLAGNLFLGYLGDEKGRKQTYGRTLMLLVICSIASGLSCGRSPTAVITTFFFFQFWLGFGAGGVYPLSATIMSEYANKRRRGTFIAAVFLMHGLGNLTSAMVSFIVTAVFKAKYRAPAYEVDPVSSVVPEADYIWRLVLMLGAVPAALSYYWLTKLPETARYTALVSNNAKQAVADLPKVLHLDLEAEQDKLEQFLSESRNDFGLLSMHFLRRHGLHLLGTATISFLLGITSYSYDVLLKDVWIHWFHVAETTNAIEVVYKLSEAKILLVFAIKIPGYLLAVICIDKIGRLRIQLMGFFFMALFMFASAIPYHHWTAPDNQVGHVVIYSLAFISARFGSVALFVVPAEIFPTRLRSTCHGISAAAGRAGQIVGTFWFLFVADGLRVRITVMILGIVGFLGMLLTLLIPETNGKSLEELSGEAE